MSAVDAKPGVIALFREHVVAYNPAPFRQGGFWVGVVHGLKSLIHVAFSFEKRGSKVVVYEPNDFANR